MKINLPLLSSTKGVYLRLNDTEISGFLNQGTDPAINRLDAFPTSIFLLVSKYSTLSPYLVVYFAFAQGNARK